ncbi:MAG: hypothetical protein ALECFALPRED_000975 [Alectoria fallacina]|uniref:Rhodopsin domain-containing protein n=1 Tax=Alectoria fallacina TaxID=1903189 RepID=A0A8H3JA46_9LECA|nr:MAG: hypothetical protein ALECFALPRED_000975 [Alectoria fallacina]
MTAIQDVRVHAPLVLAEGAILIFVCSVMVFLRFYARQIAGSSLGLDDWAIAAALLFVVGMAVTLITETSLKGLGYASSEGDAGRGHPDANVAGWPGELIQVPALGCIKLSFLLLYRRVFTNRVSRRFSWANWFMIAVIVAWMIGYFFTLLFLCGTNFKAYWTSSSTERDDCLPTKPVHLGYAVSDVITDVLTILVPIPEIWKLHLPTHRKFAITGVFGLGAITIAMSIIRMVIYYKALTVQFDPDADFEYITTLTSYFSLLEAGLGLCAACLPVQYGLLRSEKVRSIFRSIYSLATLGSRGSRSSRTSRDPMPGNKNGSQSSEMDAPLPTYAAAAAGHGARHSELEMGNLRGARAVRVATSFDASEQAV